MALSVEHRLRTAAALEQSLFAIARTPAEDVVMFDLFRNAAVKSFELSQLPARFHASINQGCVALHLPRSE